MGEGCYLQIGSCTCWRESKVTLANMLNIQYYSMLCLAICPIFGLETLTIHGFKRVRDPQDPASS